MRVTPSGFTIAEYCQQMTEKNIVVNRNYQRSNKVWPAAARSFLIDTILNGFPMPKLSLYQKTDLRTRKTIKEIVDGQQRSQAILDFFNDELRISSRGNYYGKTYSRLTPEEQQSFIDYQLSVDLFVDATEDDIRQLFRRVNSYNVPLNPQEKRHSTYQGPFKWFILQQSSNYAQTFKDLGTFNESQLSRMDDSKFIADICVAFSDGLISASEARIEKTYKSFDQDFPQEGHYESLIAGAMNDVLAFREPLGDELTKKYHLYCLILAFVHKRNPIPSLQPIFHSDGHGVTNIQATKENLSRLTEAIASGVDSNSPVLREFIEASSKTTDRQIQRAKRFRILCEEIV
ncbi:MAG: DUF262 domain-containing protein [Burkholderiales bacterium]|nr:DUF262 domain-containing protein [Burkholderiales bacterium]